MKKHYTALILLFLFASIFCVFKQNDSAKALHSTTELKPKHLTALSPENQPKNTRQLFAQQRLLHEFNMQKNPLSGTIPMEEKQRELDNTLLIKQESNLRTTAFRRAASNNYISRGPSNFGGRTRALAVDLLDVTSNTMLSGGVSSGLFRTTNGGVNWSKVSPNDEIHNVTALAQDPRTGFQNNWYYATGEWSGNSASLGSAFRGHGVWSSSDSGVTWTKIPETDSDFERFDSKFDYINALKAHPISGHLLIAATGEIYSYDGNTLTTELELPSNDLGWTDVVIATNGRVFASLEDSGVWTSPTGNGSWTQIAENGTPTDWGSVGRIVLAEAPSNSNVIYALYVNGNDAAIEADLWKYDLSTDTWTDYSSKLPDEAGGDLEGNDPFAVQSGYDLVISVKPDDENFVVIGGTNVYKIEDIVNDATFARIGGYATNVNYAVYEVGGVVHHPDIHALEFDPYNSSVMYSGTDGGIHKTVDITAASIPWVSLNNNYVTYQFYHVALDPTSGSDVVLGGAQDNGTKVGGTDAGSSDNTTMASVGSGDGVAVGIGKSDAATGIQLYAGSQGGRIFSFANNQWRTITPEDSDSQFVTYFYLDPDNNDYLYYAGNDTLYKTNSATTVSKLSWSNAKTLSTGENLRTFATTRGIYIPAISYLLIGGESGGIFRLNNPINSTDLNTAINITPPTATTSNFTIVSGLAIHPTNPDIVLAVYANYGINNIFLTSNATSANPTWTLVEQNLSAHSIRSAAITLVGSEIRYFVATARGLYSNSDPVNDDWDIEGANTIGLAVVSSLAYRPSDNRLLIGTHGNGMFDTTVQGTLATNDFSKTTDVFLSPNPTQDVLNFRSKTLDFSTTVGYKIHDLTGKIILNGTLNNQKVDVRSLTSGVYFVNLSVGNTNQSIKFIKAN